MIIAVRSRVLIVSTLTAFLLSACAGPDSSSTTAALPDPDQGGFAFGEPADESDADRVVEIVTTNDLRFNPAELSATVGETITFRIVNEGSVIHDFTLGDVATQDQHEEEMADMGRMAHDQVNAVTLAAGETNEITWTFTQAGTVLIGCHQPGHYDAGMKGRVTVQG
jgi:uncharacterized cupredoxin-like copper-binding protein